jgi:tetratricopeptide (TPR) repeat protein
MKAAPALLVPPLALSLLVGCVDATDSAARSPERPIILPETTITRTDPATLEALFRAATDQLVREDFQAAAAELDRVAAVDPKGPWAGPSLFNAGVAYVSLGEYEKAAARFRASLEVDPSGPTARLATLRLCRLAAYLEQWKELEDVARKLLARSDLSVLERIEAQGALGLSLVSLDRVDEAFEVIVAARDEIEDRRLGQAGVPPPELAQVAFALGEIRRKRAEKITFVPFPPDFGVKLEERCQGLLDAQSAYTDAMRSLDAHWSAMAGFRVGQLYQDLHRDVMQVGVPISAKTVHQKQLWEGAMRLRYRILLEKGLTMMEGTVRLGERTGESSPWIARARAAKKELETALATEKEALAKMPFTEDEMRQALEELKGKKPAPATKP